MIYVFFSFRSGSIMCSLFDEYIDKVNPGDILRFSKRLGCPSRCPSWRVSFLCLNPCSYTQLFKNQLTLYLGRQGGVLERLGESVCFATSAPRISSRPSFRSAALC